MPSQHTEALLAHGERVHGVARLPGYLREAAANVQG